MVAEEVAVDMEVRVAVIAVGATVVVAVAVAEVDVGLEDGVGEAVAILTSERALPS
jgi:hypothetical protein